MEAEAVVGLDISHGIHPKIVAEDFGVHLRTVFRWIKNGRLTSSNGRVKDDYKNTSLPDWKRTCGLSKVTGKLQVSNGTRRNWEKKKLLATTKVMGFKRALIDSVENIIQCRKRGTFSLHPTHSLPQLILEITGVEYLTLKKALDNGTVLSELIKGVRMIPNEEVEIIRRDWTSSGRSRGAQKILGKSRDTIRRWVVSGRLPSVIVLGQRRIILKSIAKTPEEKQRLKDYLRLEKRKYKRRVKAGVTWYRNKVRTEKNEKKKEKLKLEKSREKFRAKRMEVSYGPSKSVAVPIPDYQPKPVQVRGFESRRLTTCEEAAKATGKSPTEIRNLFMVATLRGEMIDDEVFIYLLSLETLIAKLKQGTIH